MGKESFQYLYPVLTALIDNTDNWLISADTILKDTNADELREEAEKVLAMIDNYKEPELPFKNVTQEDIDKAFTGMDERYGFVIWSNYLAGSDEDCAARVKDDPDYYIGLSEDMVRQMSYESYSEDRDILKEAFAMFEGPILITGTVGRWDGKRPVFTVKQELNDIWSVFTGNTCTLYIKDDMLKAENCHHDGTDSFDVYMFKKDFDPEADECTTKNDVLKGAISAVPILNKCFRWGLTEKGAE